MINLSRNAITERVEATGAAIVSWNSQGVMVRDGNTEFHPMSPETVSRIVLEGGEGPFEERYLRFNGGHFQSSDADRKRIRREIRESRARRAA